MEILVIEGTRGAGKSTVASILRRKIWGATLMNPTGFEQDGEEGLNLIRNYYEGIFKFLDLNIDNPHPIIFDRFFFTEQVIHKFHKSYDFDNFYKEFCRLLSKHQTYIFFLTVEDSDELSSRLGSRDKSKLFGKVAETVSNSLKYQEGYKDMFDKLNNTYPNIPLTEVDTSRLTSEEISQLIIDKLDK